MDLYNSVLDINDTYFMSDNHFFHKNIVKEVSSWSDLSGCRNFNSIEDMNEIIINHINEVVPTNGILINLGDIIFGDKSNLINILDRINCKNHHYIFGNHDDWMYNKPAILNLFTSTQQYLQFFLRLNSGCKVRVCCSHYPMSSWNDMNKGSWMVHGHCHQSILHKTGKIIDVGMCDIVNDCRPYSATNILKYMDSREIIKVDHH